MSSRDDMVRAFQAAFDEWDRRHSVTPMDGPTEGRGAYFAHLLDELAAGGQWNEIGR